MPQRILTTVTVHTDRDPSCNVYSLTQEFEDRVSAPPTPGKLAEYREKVEQAWRESFPRRLSAPIRPPVDVATREVTR